MGEKEEIQEERDEWCLEAIWVKLSVIQMNMDKLTFEGSGDVYDMMVKCIKIVNKAISARGRKNE